MDMVKKKGYRIRWDEESRQCVDEAHAAGVKLANTHLSVFLKEQVRVHGYSRLEVASALLIMAYNVLRRDRPRFTACVMFDILAERARKYIDEVTPSRLN